MTTPTQHARASMPATKAKITPLLAAARVIYAALLAQLARFPAPVPTLVILFAQITALDLAEQAIATSPRGSATAARNAARNLLWGSLLSLKSYVQTVADADAANDVAIIKSAGYDVAKTTPHDKPVLSAELSGQPGEVKLEGNVRALTGSSSTKRVFYNWAYSLDGGHTWVSVPSTNLSKTTITGLPVMTNVSFRVCVTVNDVAEPWAQSVTLPIH